MKDYTVSTGGYQARPFIKNITLDDGTGEKRRSTDTSNKTFFSNIKAQLNSIRTDVTKLVAKDAAKPISSNKSYNFTSTNSAQKSDSYNAQLPIEKKLQKKTSHQSSQKSYPSITTSIHLQNTSNAKFQSKISQIQSKLAQTQAKLQQTQVKLVQTQSKYSQQNKKYAQMKSQFDQQRKNQVYLRDQIGTLKQNAIKLQQKIFTQNKQIEMLQTKLNTTNQQKQDAMLNIQRLQLDIKKNSSLPRQDSQLNEKLFQQQRNINLLLDNLRKLQTQNNILKKKQQNIENQNFTLKKNLESLESSKQIQIASISKNYQDKLNRVEAKSFKQLGAGFQVKINDLLDENYSLKNKINLLQSQTQQDRIQIQSLLSTIEAYQTRDNEVGRGINQIQNQNLRNQVMELKQRMDKIQSDHEYEIMKFQNTIDQLKSNPSNKNSDNKTFNQILKDQIAQIQNLKEKLRQKNQLITKLKK